jgi:hypothetical protein
VVTDVADSTGTRSRRVVLWVGGAAALLWTVALLASAWYLLFRPDCPDGWVRLFDFGPLPIVSSAAGLAGTVAILVPARGQGRHRVLAVLACVSLVLAMLFAVAATTTMVQTIVGGADPSCWTF